MPDAYDDVVDLGGGDDDWDDITLPPGEEAGYMSHTGGESILHRVMEGVRPGYVVVSYSYCSLLILRRRGDPRTRSMRVQKQVESWTTQMPLLVEAYLQYKNLGPISVDTQGLVWSLTVIGFDESGLESFSHTADVVKANETLVRRGYLGSSPDKPALAFSLRTLEIYRQLHRVCPRFTIDSLAKTLNYLHKVPRKAYLAEQLTNAYDAYLKIQRRVYLRVKAALGRDETWDAKNVCPPCFYRVENEAPLKYSFLGALDGNNSLKLVDSTFRAGNPCFDNRKSTSFRWLTPTEVDKYKDKVKNSPKVNSANGVDGSQDPEPMDDDVAWLNVNELTAEETDELAKCLNTCVERWKAAGPEACKKMFALFAVAGIFISVCRHGHVLLIAT
ncbi:hypothetical protein B0H14DRAFT_2422395 [Mycena olivaceomarginata]|nr:hypothetical protein B0H14DRAFT_2422395 [Mycena olivaceomarginata]